MDPCFSWIGSLKKISSPLLLVGRLSSSDPEAYFLSLSLSLFREWILHELRDVITSRPTSPKMMDSFFSFLNKYIEREKTNKSHDLYFSAH